MIQFREGGPNDCESIARLMGQLGYPCQSIVMRERLASLNSLSSLVLLAEISGKVIGLIHMEVRITLMVQPMVEIVSFVIDESYRGAGIGRQLLAAAEHWALKKGYNKIQLYTNAKRLDAHRFYVANGFSKVKDSILMAEAF